MRTPARAASVVNKNLNIDETRILEALAALVAITHSPNEYNLARGRAAITAILSPPRTKPRHRHAKPRRVEEWD